MPAPLSKRNLTIIGILATLITASLGLFVMLSRFAYAEPGHGWLAAAYGAACVGLFFAIRFWRLAIFFLLLIIMVGTQIYAAKKFDWRQTYIDSAQQGRPFPLEEMIDHYPTYEEHLFKFLGYPDWADFYTDCIAPTANVPVNVPPTCASFDSIMQAYNVDVPTMMQFYYGKMKKTAQMIQEGKLTQRNAYATCIANKGCATIPLLPKGVDATKIDPTSKEYLEVRQAFWSLINDKKMSPTVCNQMEMCKILIMLKLVNPERLPF